MRRNFVNVKNNLTAVVFPHKQTQNYIDVQHVLRHELDETRVPFISYLTSSSLFSGLSTYTRTRFLPLNYAPNIDLAKIYGTMKVYL